MGMLSSAWQWLKNFPAALRLANRLVRKGVGERLFASTSGGMSYWGGGYGGMGSRHEQAQHFRSFVFIAVRAIANRVAALEPVVAHVRDGDGPRDWHSQKLHEDYCKKAIGGVRPHEDFTPAGHHHPLVRLLRKPNAWDTAGELWYELILFLELTGDGYLWCPPTEYGLRSGMMTPAELWVVPSHWVEERWGMKGLDCYRVMPLAGSGRYFELPPSEVIHLKWKSPLTKHRGHSPQQAGSEWIDVAESINKARFWQFKNGCFPIGHVELDEKYADPSEEDIERLYAKFFNRLQGEANTGRPIITPPGAKYNPLQIAPSEMGYVESSAQMADWVMALFGVPKEIAGLQPVGNDMSWYAPMLQFTENVLGPKLRYLGQSLSRWLCPRYSDDLRLWWDNPAQDNPEKLNRDLALAAAHGQITSEEFRAAMGRRPFTPQEKAEYSKLGKDGSPQQGPPGPPQAPGPQAGVRPSDVNRALSGAVTKGDWREQDHPRADDGRFGDKAGAASSGDDQEAHGAGGEGEGKGEAREAALAKLLDAEVLLDEGELGVANYFPPESDPVHKAQLALHAAVRDGDTAAALALGRELAESRPRQYAEAAAAAVGILERAGASEGTLRAFAGDLARGEAAVARVSQRVAAAADKLQAAVEAKGALGPAPAEPPAAEDYSAAIDELDGEAEDYVERLDELEARQAEAEAAYDKAYAAYEKAADRHAESLEKLTDRVAEAEDRLGERAGEAEDVAALWLGERFDRAAERAEARVRREIDAARDALGADDDEGDGPEEKSLRPQLRRAFEESKHPRADDGKFGSGSGSNGHAGNGKAPAATKPAGKLSRAAGALKKYVAAPVWVAVKKAGHKAAHVEHVVKQFITEGIPERIDAIQNDKLRAAVAGIWTLTKLGTKAAFLTYTAGQRLAADVAKAAGASDAQTSRLGAVCTALDLTGAKAIPIALGAVGLGPVGAFAGSMVPMGSAAYLAYSAARRPVALIRSAMKAVSALAGGGNRDNASRFFAGEGSKAAGGARGEVEALLKALQAHEGDDNWEACLFAALDHADDLTGALALADKASGEMSNG